MAEGNTDNNGLAVFSVEAGTYLVTASKSGFVTKQSNIIVSQDITLDIILESTPPLKYTLTVKLVGSEGNPIPNVRVIVV